MKPKNLWPLLLRSMVAIAFAATLAGCGSSSSNAPEITPIPQPPVEVLPPVPEEEPTPDPELEVIELEPELEINLEGDTVVLPAPPAPEIPVVEEDREQDAPEQPSSPDSSSDLQALIESNLNGLVNTIQNPFSYQEDTVTPDFSSLRNKTVTLVSDHGDTLNPIGPVGNIFMHSKGGTSSALQVIMQGRNMVYLKSKFYGSYLSANSDKLTMKPFSGADSQKFTLIPNYDHNPPRFHLQTYNGRYVTHDSDHPELKLVSFSDKPVSWDFRNYAGSGPLSSVKPVLSSLSGIASAKWPMNNIPVCWENPSAGDVHWRSVVQEAVEDSWQAVSKVKFFGWQRCTSHNPGIRISIEDSGAHVKKLGYNLNGMRNGMVLNFTFNNWNGSCRDDAVKGHCIRTIAIHEFGHALGFTHEHNRFDAPLSNSSGTICTDAPQATTGTWDITSPDSKSIMNYCFGSSYSGELSDLDIQGVRAWYGSNLTSGSEQRNFAFKPIDHLCPTNLISGDREFGGRGPRMSVRVKLEISKDKRSLIAVVDFLAAEYAGFLENFQPTVVSQRFVRTVWSEPGLFIESIDSDNVESTVRATSQPGGFELMCTDKEAGVIANPVIEGGLVKRIELIGDTGADDVSVDSNCDCDMQIKRIEFNPVKITVSKRIR